MNGYKLKENLNPVCDYFHECLTNPVHQDDKETTINHSIDKI